MTRRELHDWYRFELHHQALPDALADNQNALLCFTVARTMGADKVAPSDFFCIRQPEPAPPEDGLDDIDRLKLAWRGEI